MVQTPQATSRVVAYLEVMKRSRAAPDMHPFAIPFFAGIAAAIFGLLYWLFGIGGSLFHWAVTIALFYATIVAITFAIAGVIWGAIKLFGGRK
jgi:hypothetical protein